MDTLEKALDSPAMQARINALIEERVETALQSAGIPMAQAAPGAPGYVLPDGATRTFLDVIAEAQGIQASTGKPVEGLGAFIAHKGEYELGLLLKGIAAAKLPPKTGPDRPYVRPLPANANERLFRPRAFDK